MNHVTVASAPSHFSGWLPSRENHIQGLMRSRFPCLKLSSLQLGSPHHSQISATSPSTLKGIVIPWSQENQVTARTYFCFSAVNPVTFPGPHRDLCSSNGNSPRFLRRETSMPEQPQENWVESVPLLTVELVVWTSAHVKLFPLLFRMSRWGYQRTDPLVFFVELKFP